jgi:hypothetical protein
MLNGNLSFSRTLGTMTARRACRKINEAILNEEET